MARPPPFKWNAKGGHLTASAKTEQLARTFCSMVSEATVVPTGRMEANKSVEKRPCARDLCPDLFWFPGSVSRLSVDLNARLVHSHSLTRERDHTLIACRPNDDESASVKQGPMIRLKRLRVFSISGANGRNDTRSTYRKIHFFIGVWLIAACRIDRFDCNERQVLPICMDGVAIRSQPQGCWGACCRQSRLGNNPIVANAFDFQSPRGIGHSE